MIRLRVWISATVMLVMAIFCAIWISKSHLKSNNFIPTHEYRLVPEDAVIPRGLDIKIDMQTGQKWARLPKKEPTNGVMFVKDGEPAEKPSTSSENKPPAYSNTSSKWKGRFQSVSAAIEQALAELEFEVSREDAYELLEEEASALEVGAGILHSSKFVWLRKLLLSDPQALNLLNICLQNNPPAVFKAVELGILEHEISVLLQQVTDAQVLKRIIQVLNSFLIHGDDSEPVSEIVDLFKRQRILPKLLEAIQRTNSVRTERQLVILLRISSAVNEDLPDFSSNPAYSSALSKHCESYPKSKAFQ